MTAIDDSRIEHFVAQCRRAARDYRLMKCSSGNASWRIDNGLMLVSASKSWLSDLTADQVTVCRVADGAPVQGPKPTIEIAFHAGILRARPDINVVIHFQTPFATVLTCRKEPVDYYVLPEAPYYLGPVATIPFLLPGSKELADAVIAAMTGHNVGILQNHGQITVGKDFNETIQRAVFFEMVCETIVRGGETIQPIPRAMIEKLGNA